MTFADAPKNANEEIPRDERTIYTGIRIAGQWIDFEERLFLEGTVAMMVPSEFQEMDREIAKIANVKHFFLWFGREFFLKLGMDFFLMFGR